MKFDLSPKTDKDWTVHFSILPRKFESDTGKRILVWLAFIERSKMRRVTGPVPCWAYTERVWIDGIPYLREVENISEF